MDNVLTGFDNHFPNGVFTETSKDIPMYDFKKMRAYCKRKGIATSKLTEKELLMFLVSDSCDSSKLRSKPNARKAKKQITISVDNDTVVYFKSMAAKSGMPYKTLINQYLTECATQNREMQVTSPK